MGADAPRAPAIRPAAPGDVSALAALARRCFTETFGHLYDAKSLEAHLSRTCSESFFRDALAKGDSIFLARDGEALAGYAKSGALGLPVEAPPSSGELHRLYVLAPYHGTGLAQRLMEAALAAPPLAESHVIYLGVWERNHRAQRFYARYGFECVGEYDYPVGRYIDRELILRRMKGGP